MPDGEVTFCPRCKKAVEAKDYMDLFYLGFDSVLPRIRCRCGYSGLPLTIAGSEYQKLISSSKPGTRSAGRRR